MENLNEKLAKPCMESLAIAIDISVTAGVSMPSAFTLFSYTVDEFSDVVLDALILQQHLSPMADRAKGGMGETLDVYQKNLVDCYDSGNYLYSNNCEKLADAIADTFNQLKSPTVEQVNLASNCAIPAPAIILRFDSTTRKWLEMVHWVEIVIREIKNLAD